VLWKMSGKRDGFAEARLLSLLCSTMHNYQKINRAKRQITLPPVRFELTLLPFRRASRSSKAGAYSAPTVLALLCLALGMGTCYTTALKGLEDQFNGRSDKTYREVGK